MGIDLASKVTSRKTFGHELHHCLNGDHHEDDETYGDNGYEKHWWNYMSQGVPIVIPNPFFYDWQICSMNLKDQWSVQI